VAAHFFLPSWALLLEAMEKGGSFLALFLGEPRELLFELKKISHAHGQWLLEIGRNSTGVLMNATKSL
jgi:hypothetical protein